MLAASLDDIGDDLTWQPAAREAWDELYRRAGRSGLEQSWAYGEAVAGQHNYTMERHVIAAGSTPLALVQAYRKTYWHIGVTRILRGPVWLIEPPGDPLGDPRGAAVCAAIARRYRGRRLDFLSWLPELPDDPRSEALLNALGFRRVVTGYASAWLDLRQSPEALLAGLQGKWRAALHKAEREGLAISLDGKARQKQAALLLYDTFRRKKRFVGPPGDFIAAIDAADGKALLSLSARQGDKLVAGVILLRHGASATYMASWTSGVGRAGQAHNLLLWHGIEELRKSGIQWLDLGGLNTESQRGLARFKLGLGGEVFTLTGSYL
ncbi:GNAT family N-acetyltransferase [Pelagibius marinus]|uniref:GNAT family N-acetyltransferase n=1 Tax=Pelagibius marinus TaxID=2762760 RepID=UPI001872D32C|nr:GNAT family N-acetyltransferase [Pelagibius marinus]